MKKTFVIIIVLVLIIGGSLFGYYFINNIINSKKQVATADIPENNSKVEDFNKKADYQLVLQPDYIAVSIEDLYKDADLVIRGKLIKNNKCHVLDSSIIATEAQFEILETLKGSYNSKNININYYGGIVSVEEYISKQTKDQIKKKGFDSLSQDERNSLNIELSVDETEAKVSSNKEYLIFLGYNREKNYYIVLADGYGMREISKDGKIYNLDTKTFDTKLTDLK